MLNLRNAYIFKSLLKVFYSKSLMKVFYRSVFAESSKAFIFQKFSDGEIGIFGFAVLAIFWIGVSVFVPKDFGFGVHCGLRMFLFLASGFRFS